MKTLFDVGADDDSGATLLMEVGSQHCAYAYWQPGQGRFRRLAFVAYERTEAERSLADLVGSLPERFSAVYVASAFEQAVLTPQKLFKDDGVPVLNAVYKAAAQRYRYDAIPEWGVVNAWSVPQGVEEAIQPRFPSAQYVHAYTCTLKVYNGFVADHQLSVHFTPSQFRILFKKDSALQLAQTYAYKTPLDVVYYLLKIAQAFELPQSDLHLIVSGLVDGKSALFAELQAYFSNVHFAHPPAAQLPDGEYHQHYFTPLYNLAQCVS